MAIAYVMQKTTHVFPIIGGRKVEHLHANIAALDIALTDAHITKIEAASPFFKGMMYMLFVGFILLIRCAFVLTHNVMILRATAPTTAPSTVMQDTSIAGCLPSLCGHVATREDVKKSRKLIVSLFLYSCENLCLESDSSMYTVSIQFQIEGASTMYAK